MKNTLLFLGGLALSALAAAAIGTLFGVSVLAVFVVLNVIGLIPTPKGSLFTVTQNTLIGQSRQKIGNAVFSTWKGINVLRSKPMSVANPKTDAQVQQRSAFSQMVQAFRLAPAAIRAGFKKQAIGMSEYNAFVKANIGPAYDRTTPGVATLIPANIITSKGTIAASAVATTVADKSDNEIRVTWSHTSLQPGQSLTDKAVLVAYNATKDSWTGGATNDLRSSDAAAIDLPGDWATGDTLHVYTGFYNQLSGESSDSVHTTATITA